MYFAQWIFMLSLLFAYVLHFKSSSPPDRRSVWPTLLSHACCKTHSVQHPAEDGGLNGLPASQLPPWTWPIPGPRRWMVVFHHTPSLSCLSLPTFFIAPHLQPRQSSTVLTTSSGTANLSLASCPSSQPFYRLNSRFHQP
jgi:hypothetical protein